MKKTFITLSIILVTLIVILTGAGIYMTDYALKPANRSRNLAECYSNIFDNYPHLEAWVDSLKDKNALRDTFMINDEGKKMHAYYIRAAVPTSKTAVIVHGYTDGAIRIFPIGYMYSHDLKYNVMIPDLNNHGKSEGENIQMGWKDRLDVLKWMEIANETFGDSTKMVVHGISMGAATTMMVSGEKQDYYVKCFVEDCGYTSVWDQFAKQLKEEFSLPEFPILYAASLVSKLRFGWNFKEANALNQVAKSVLPMMFIHGDKDDYVPTYMVYPLYEAKVTGDKQLWIVPGAQHANSYKRNQKEYTERVKEFTDKYIR